MSFIKKVLLFLLIFLFKLIVFAQNIETPKQFFGYELGEEFTNHYKVIDYFEHVSKNSPNVKLVSYGKTYEMNPLVIAIVSSEENIKDLEKYRLANLEKTGLIPGESAGNQKPIVWLSYGVHGNESVSTEVALGVLYKLVSGEKEVNNWLDDLIIVIDPCLNPDGRERYVTWYKQIKNLNPNMNFDSREHRELWPGGRPNHYLFDLNRDWAWLIQQETAQRIKIYHEWMPHIHVDFHEMGHRQSYFFAPGALPYHNALTDWQIKFQKIMGKELAGRFDENNWLYFTSEIFDLFSPNFGDTWPNFNGAMGFTYEQGGSGRAGLAVAIENDTITLKKRYDHHYVASIVTIESASKYKEQLLSGFNKYFSESINAPEGEYKSYVIKSNNDPDKIRTLLKYLDNQKITYAYPESFAKKLVGYNYKIKKEIPFALDHKDIVISAYQPKSHFLRIMFEPISALTDSLTYDLTSWSLPFVYDIEMYAVKKKLELSSNPVTVETKKNEIYSDDPYAFLIEWTSIQDAKLLSNLLNSDIKVRYANKPFKYGNKSYKRGTIIISKYDNRNYKGNLKETLVKIANQYQQELHFVNTGWTDFGIDLGSDAVRLIKKSKVALLSGDSFNSAAFGEIWYFFDVELQYPVTVLRSDYFSRINLSKYDVLIFPSGNISELDEKDKIFDFIKGGGKVIALENAIKFFAKDSSTILGKEYAKQKKKFKAERIEEKDVKKYENKRRDFLTSRVQGSIYKIHFDETHPLSFGMDKEWCLLKRNNDVYPLLSGRGWNVGIIKNDGYVSGFAGYKFKNKVDNSLVLGTENIGSGKVVYLTDSPIYRGFWYSGKLLFSNLIFFY